MTIKLVYNGVYQVEEDNGWFTQGSKPPKPDLERSEKAIRRMLNGDRVFMIVDPTFDYDLEETDADNQSDFERKAKTEFVKVELDGEQRLRITQQLSFPNWTAGMEMANFELRNELREDLEKFQPGPDSEWLDQATVDLFLADIRNGHNWLTWNEAGLQINFPVSPQLLANLLRDGLDQVANISAEELKTLPSGFRFFSKALTSLSELTVQDNRVTFTFTRDDSGWMKFIFDTTVGTPVDEEPPKYDSRLVDHLTAQGIELPAQYKAPTL